MGRDVEPILEKRRHKQKLSHYQEPEQPSAGILHSSLIVATKLQSQQPNFHHPYTLEGQRQDNVRLSFGIIF
jgi:hypothetical protein